MLNLMRKHASSWMIKVLLFAIVVVFSFWGVGSFRNRQATSVAKVNGEVISYETYRKSYDNLVEQYRRVYGANLTDNMMAILRPKETALDNLIYRILTLQEAHRLGLQVTDQELDKAIMDYPAFQIDGVFNQDRAKQILSLSNFSSGEFRQSYKEDLLINKMRAMVLDGVSVSDKEARQWYDWQNAETNIAYVLFPPEQYKDINPTPEEIKAFFEANKENYKTDPEVKVSYLFFNPKDFKDKVRITDGEIKEYYDTHPGEFRKEKTVEARHILFKLAENADEKTVAAKKELADKVYAMAKAGQDFAKLAETYSEGPTRDKGGYLGTFNRESMVKAFADKAFSMKAGEVSEPVRTRFGWHIIKVEKVNDAATQPLEAVRDTIRSKLLAEKERVLALEKAENVYDNIFDGEALTKVAEAQKLTVVTTDFFTLKNPPRKGIGNPRKFAETAFELEPMAISEVLDLGNGYCLLQVVDRKEAAIPDFKAVADKVKADVILKMQKEHATADAQKLLTRAKDEGLTLSEAAAKTGFKEMETGFFKRTGSIPKIGYEPQITQAAFKCTKEHPLADQVLQGRQGAYVIRLIERKAPDKAGFEKDKTEIEARLIGQKKQAAMQQWLTDLKQHGQIDINRKLIE